MEETIRKLLVELVDQNRTNAIESAKQSAQIEALIDNMNKNAEQTKELAREIKNISVTKESIDNFSKRVDIKFTELEKTLDKVEERLIAVEQRPATEALKTQKAIKKYIIAGIAGLIVSALIYFFANGGLQTL